MNSDSDLYNSLITLLWKRSPPSQPGRGRLFAMKTPPVHMEQGVLVYDENYAYRSSSAVKSRVMEVRLGWSLVKVTPADWSIRLEARVDRESAYLSER